MSTPNPWRFPWRRILSIPYQQEINDIPHTIARQVRATRENETAGIETAHEIPNPNKESSPARRAHAACNAASESSAIKWPF